MSNKTKTILTLILIASVFLFVATPVLASHDGWVEKVLGGQHLIPEACTDTSSNKGEDIVKRCGLSAIFQTIVNVSKLILALTGSVALLMFIYGGFLFIIAAGSQEKITKGKEAMKTAAIGVIIILGAFLMVNFTIFALTGGQGRGLDQVQTIFGRPFSQEQIIDSSTFDDLGSYDYTDSSEEACANAGGTEMPVFVCTSYCSYSNEEAGLMPNTSGGNVCCICNQF